MSAVMKPGPADGPPPECPAEAHSSARRRLRLWAMLTVQLPGRALRDSRMASGVPTILLRPTTTQWRPSVSILLRASSSMTPFGVAVTKAGRAEAHAAEIFRAETVDVPGAVDGEGDFLLVDMGGEGNLHDKAVRWPHRAFSSATLASSSASLVSAPRRTTVESKPTSFAVPDLVGDVGFAGAVVSDEYCREMRNPSAPARAGEPPAHRFPGGFVRNRPFRLISAPPGPP